MLNNREDAYIMTKRIIAIVILIIVVTAVACGCGSGRLTKKDFLIRTDIADIQMGEELEISGSEKAELMEYGIFVDDNYASIMKSDQNIKLANGIGVGDDVKKVVKVYGKNLMYDEFKDKETYELVYFYYEKNGKLESVSDKISYGDMQMMSFDEEEAEYFEKIKSDLQSCDTYSIKFIIKDNVVEKIALLFMKAPM